MFYLTFKIYLMGEKRINGLIPTVTQDSLKDTMYDEPFK